MKNVLILMLTFFLLFQKSYSQINDANTLYEQLTSQSVEAQNYNSNLSIMIMQKKIQPFWREENKFKASLISYRT